MVNAVHADLMYLLPRSTSQFGQKVITSFPSIHKIDELLPRASRKKISVWRNTVSSRKTDEFPSIDIKTNFWIQQL